MTVLHACAFFHIREKYAHKTVSPTPLNAQGQKGGERYE